MHTEHDRTGAHAQLTIADTAFAEAMTPRRHTCACGSTNPSACTACGAAWLRRHGDLAAANAELDDAHDLDEAGDVAEARLAYRRARYLAARATKRWDRHHTLVTQVRLRRSETADVAPATRQERARRVRRVLAHKAKSSAGDGEPPGQRPERITVDVRLREPDGTEYGVLIDCVVDQIAETIALLASVLGAEVLNIETLCVGDRAAAGGGAS
jgi:hypothetical protein